MYQNVRFKYYGDTLVEVMYCDKSIFQDDPQPKKGGRKQENEAAADIAEDGKTSGADNLARSQRRAKKAVFDLCACNPDLDLFCTFTIDREKLDRYDYTAIMKKLKNFLDNRVRRKNLKYVLVAELHKDGAIHFHALCNSAALDMVDSGKVDKRGNKVYNLPEWSWGFTTAIRTYGDSRSGVCAYITKYITKSDEKVGGRWYYHGGDLRKPRFEYVTDNYYGEHGETPVKMVEYLGEGFKCFNFEPDGVNFKFTIFRKEVF